MEKIKTCFNTKEEKGETHNCGWHWKWRACAEEFGLLHYRYAGLLFWYLNYISNVLWNFHCCKGNFLNPWRQVLKCLSWALLLISCYFYTTKVIYTLHNIFNYNDHYSEDQEVKLGCSFSSILFSSMSLFNIFHPSIAHYCENVNNIICYDYSSELL